MIDTQPSSSTMLFLVILQTLVMGSTASLPRQSGRLPSAGLPLLRKTLGPGQPQVHAQLGILTQPHETPAGPHSSVRPQGHSWPYDLRQVLRGRAGMQGMEPSKNSERRALTKIPREQRVPQGHLVHRGYPQQDHHEQINGRQVGLLQMAQLHTPTTPNDATHRLGQPAALYDSLMVPRPARQGTSTHVPGTLAEQKVLTQFQERMMENVQIPTFGTPALQRGTAHPAGRGRHIHTYLRPTEPTDLTQAYQGPRVTYSPEQPGNHDPQDIIAGSLQVPSHPKGPAYPALGGSCSQGQVVHADGSCVVPEVTRDLYVFSIPDTPRRPAGPPPALPPPRVHEHVLFIRAPKSGLTEKPLLVPPPAQKSVVYILREDSPDEEQRIIQAPAPPPARPEVFFVNYEDGENPTLHGGLDLQQVLQTVTSAPPALQDAAAPHHVQEQQTHSLLAGHAGGDLVLEDHSDEDLTLAGFTAHGVNLGGHSVDDSVATTYTDESFSQEMPT